MLTPEYLDVCASDLVAIYSELDQSILALIAARIAKTKFVGDASKWQIERLQEAGLLYEEVIAAIARYSGISQDELRKMFAVAGVETITADNAIYTKAGLHPTGIKQSPAMTQVLRAGLKKTGGSLKNLTMTTAMTAQTAYINVCNLAYMQITSGAMSMPEAVRHAVRSAAKQGTTVRYPSGHTDQLDVAVRRASVTGVNQTCAEIQLANAQDMGCNHVETTAHIGARPSHAEWQGRVFMIVGSSREYPNLAEATGYGTGDGLCGWNCRHNFFPFFEGIDLRTYRDEDLEKLKNDGYYEAEQKQRYYERQIRATKRELAGYDAAITAATDGQTRAALQQEFDRASVKLKKQEGKLKDWTKEKELTPDPSRVQAGGFGRSVSQKAVWANKKGLKYKDYDDIIELKGTLSNRDVREWYITHDATIPDLIDRTAPIEEQARQACELRNKFRTQARELMADHELRRNLDANEPNRSFEELIADKMRNKEMTREQAIADILKTATKTRKEVNKKFGLE